MVALCLLAGCQEPTRPADYRTAHPLDVGMETVSLAVAPGNGGPFIGEDALHFERFVADYHDRGRKALVVKGAGAGAAQVRAMLVKAGVRESEISLAGGGGGAVTLSFNAHMVRVPECGNFTSKANPNWSNRRHADFGCATRRNLGLMVQDPGDLEQARPIRDSDGAAGARIIGSYRTPAVGGGQ